LSGLSQSWFGCGSVELTRAPSLFRDASEGSEMSNHLVRERALGHADMSRTEFIMLVAGWSTALVAVFIRFIG